MNKTDRQYFEARVEKIVKCTNGNIATILNRKKKGTGLTDRMKFKMIQERKVKLISDTELHKKQGYNEKTRFTVLLNCFEYPLTDSQKDKIAFNKSIDSRIDELMQEVELEGQRLIDKAVLSLIESKQIPDALHKLSEMANLARS